jgi:hypothetical protein
MRPGRYPLGVLYRYRPLAGSIVICGIDPGAYAQALCFRLLRRLYPVATAPGTDLIAPQARKIVDFYPA